MNTLLKIAGLFSALILTASVNANVITFGDSPLDRIDQAGVQSEADFNYVAVGEGWESETHFSVAGAALATFWNGQGATVGSYVEFTHASNALFSFESVDWRSINSPNSDKVIIEGFNNNVLVDSVAITSSDLTFSTLSGFAGLLDTLRITVTFDGTNALLFDNLTLNVNAVPAPNAIALFSFILLGAFIRRTAK